jgi:anti-sigma regulatory factor (Ser/Thr protein kinase)
MRALSSPATDGKHSEIRLEMASARAAIPKTVEKVLRAVGPVGLGSERLEDLAVAVSEALSNAAIHGNQLRPGSRVIVTVRVTPHAHAVIDVKDEGAGFDHQAVGDPTEEDRLLATSGRGVFLMGRLVDKIEFVEGGSRVRLTVGKAIRAE